MTLYERPRLTVENPRHVREYTKNKLHELGRTVGFRVVFHRYADYLGLEGGRLKRAAELCSRLPMRYILLFVGDKRSCTP